MTLRMFFTKTQSIGENIGDAILNTDIPPEILTGGAWVLGVCLLGVLIERFAPQSWGLTESKESGAQFLR